MNINETITEARLNAEAAQVLIQDDPAQLRLFGGLGLFALIAFPYTTYRILRGLVKFVN